MKFNELVHGKPPTKPLVVPPPFPVLSTVFPMVQQ